MVAAPGLRIDARSRSLYNQWFTLSRAPELSVVIPMKNEAPNVEPLYRELTDALERYGRPYEIILIDDGSTDETFQLLDRAAGARTSRSA